MSKRKFIGERGGKSAVTSHKPAKGYRTNADSVPAEVALDTFIRAREAKGLRESTLRLHRQNFGFFATYLREAHGLQNALLRDLTADMVRGYIIYMRKDKTLYEGVEGRNKAGEKGLSVSTVNIRLRSLRAMFRFWHAEGMIAINPMAGIGNVTDDERNEVPGLTDAEVDRLLGGLDPSRYADWRDHTLILLMLDTGLRVQEAVSLTVDRVDWRLPAVYVPSSIAKNRRNREIPVSREVAKMLRELYEETEGYFGEIDGIFYNAYGEPYTADAFRRRLSRRKAALGIERLSPHMFRHTFARNYLLNGGDLFTLQRILDHADIETTRKYVQMDDADVRAQHNKFSPVRRILGRGPRR